uniref:Uncharacterized protein n=1 Tax=mine drainage metagenome TaxID=410659 RepID=E6PZV3_9ZZZZ
MSNIWLLLFSRVRLRRPRWFMPIVTAFAIGLVIAGVIYACVMFQAVNTRSSFRHVHAHSSH